MIKKLKGPLIIIIIIIIIIMLIIIKMVISVAWYLIDKVEHTAL